MRRFFAAFALYLVLESFYPPPAQLSARAGEGLIVAYQHTLSKAVQAAGAQCRFTPSCSEYGRLSMRKHGFLRGTWKTMGRLVRCGPWGPPPGDDPP
ncbi:MAG TPA: membrane protein insertion efficiency factor YidD [Planctomycetota bacterium]|nr:membrane protein insertion efficiency factor YidD [Planctomycetota bacterium]